LGLGSVDASPEDGGDESGSEQASGGNEGRERGVGGPQQPEVDEGREVPGVETRAAAQRSLTGLALRLREQERAEPARLSLDAVIEHLGAGGVSAMDVLDDWCGTPPRRRWRRLAAPEPQPWLVEPEPEAWLVDLFDAAARIMVGIHDEKVRVEAQDLVDRSLQSLGS
jgi:hypothetical protein